MFFIIFLCLLSSVKAVCIGYNAPCEEMLASQCCFYPMTGCLQDARNTTSCISIMDVDNLSPMFTSLNPFTPLLQAYENATLMFYEAYAPLMNPNPMSNPMSNPLVLAPLMTNPMTMPMSMPMSNPLMLFG